MLREKDKLEIYLTKLVSAEGGSVIEARHSSYYNLRGNVLRISDHIGKNSSGNLSIIIPGHAPNKRTDYIVHAHSSGEISILDYEKVKELARTFVWLASTFNDMLQPDFKFEIEAKEKFEKVLEEKGITKEMERLKKIEERFNKMLPKYKELKEHSKTLDDVQKDIRDYIFGVHKSIFTEGQLASIMNTVTNVAKKHGIDM